MLWVEGNQDPLAQCVVGVGGGGAVGSVERLHQPFSGSYKSAGLGECPSGSKETWIYQSRSGEFTNIYKVNKDDVRIYTVDWLV